MASDDNQSNLRFMLNEVVDSDEEMNSLKKEKKRKKKAKDLDSDGKDKTKTGVGDNPNGTAKPRHPYLVIE